MKRTLKSSGILLGLLAAAVYLPMLAFGFVYLDDYLLVERSLFYSKLENVWGGFLRPVWGGGTAGYAYYRPVSTAFYVLGGWLSTVFSGELSAWAFHATNVALVFIFVALLASLLTRLGSRREVAGAASLVFILHPAMSGTAAWICGQNELLLGVWVLCALLSLIEATSSTGIRAGWAVLHSGFLLLALLTKENALALPVICAIFASGRGKAASRRWAPLVGAWIGALAAWCLLVRAMHGTSPLDLGAALQSALSAIPGLVIYVGRLFLPFSLSVLPTVRDTGVWAWFAGALGMLALTVATIPLRGERLRTAVLGWLWFLGFLAPTFYRATVAVDGDRFILREDRAFVASVGLLIVVLQLRIPEAWVGRAKGAIAAIAVLLAGLSFQHARAYRDGLSFYRAAVAGSPGLAFAHAHLGDMEIAERDYPTAIAEYGRAIALNDSEPEAHNNLGVVYLRLGDTDRAEVEFKAELGRHPENIRGLFNLGTVLFGRGDYPNAEKAWTQAVGVDPTYSEAWRGLVTLYTATKDERKRGEAEKALEQRGEYDLGKGI